MTGGSGLVGKGIRHAVETTEKRDNEEWIFLTSKDGNLLDLKETEALFEKYKPTHVIHLAALVRASNGIYCIELIWEFTAVITSPINVLIFVGWWSVCKYESKS